MFVYCDLLARSWFSYYKHALILTTLGYAIKHTQHFYFLLVNYQRQTCAKFIPTFLFKNDQCVRFLVSLAGVSASWTERAYFFQVLLRWKKCKWVKICEILTQSQYFFFSVGAITFMLIFADTTHNRSRKAKRYVLHSDRCGFHLHLF